MLLELILLYGEETTSAYELEVSSYNILDEFRGLQDISKIDRPIEKLFAIEFVIEGEQENSLFIASKKIVTSINEYITKESNKIFVNFDEKKQVVNIDGTMIWLDLGTAQKHFEALEDDSEDDEY